MSAATRTPDSIRRAAQKQNAKRKAIRHARGRVPGWNAGHHRSTTLDKYDWIRQRVGWQYAYGESADAQDQLRQMAIDAREDGIYSFDGGLKKIMHSLTKHMNRLLDERD
jgi:hypothetical protein